MGSKSEIPAAAFMALAVRGLKSKERLWEKQQGGRQENSLSISNKFKGVGGNNKCLLGMHR